MTSPTRKAPARKAPAKKAAPRKTAAAVAARREVRGEGGALPSFPVKFRDATFDIALDKMGVEKIYMREKAFQHFGGSDELVALLFDLLGSKDSSRLINELKPGDTLLQVAGEFFSAMRKAANDPNS